MDNMWDRDPTNNRRVSMNLRSLKKLWRRPAKGKSTTTQLSLIDTVNREIIHDMKTWRREREDRVVGVKPDVPLTHWTTLAPALEVAGPGAAPVSHVLRQLG